MGGKADTTAPPALDPAGNDEAMLAMMQSMMSMPAMQAPTTPTVPDAPALERTPEVDWSERHEELAARAKADFKNDQSRKKGRSATVHTSPLAEEDEVAAQSIATGG